MFERHALFRVGTWRKYETGAIMVKYMRNQDVIKIKLYGHCSCYGSESAVLGGTFKRPPESRRVTSIDWDWTGPCEDFAVLAKTKHDFAMPARRVQRADRNGPTVLKLYSVFLKWLKEGKPAWSDRKFKVADA